MSTTAIAYIIFNRPRHTRETFAAIRAQRPARLFIIADGPRPGHPTDAQRCQETREVVADIDWPCEVFRHYAEENLGCKRRVSSGLDWVFGQIDCAIVLEDDCVPHPDFFPYCDALLARYAEDPRVWVITGNNFQDGTKRGEASYYFSKFNHCWGWATWRRAWNHYEREMPRWPAFRDQGWLNQLFDNQGERDYWQASFELVHSGKLDTWDCSWTFASLINGLVQVVPNVNMISNIGFGPEATHTHVVGIHADMPTRPITLPLKHPDFVLPDLEADRYISEDQIAPSFARRQWRRVKRVLRLS